MIDTGVPRAEVARLSGSAVPTLGIIRQTRLPATALAASAVWDFARPARSAPPGGKAPFRLWYNNDTTNIVDLNTPFHKLGDPLTDQAIEGTIDEVAGRGVDAYAFCAGLGHVPVWKSAVYPDHFSWWTKKTGSM